MVRHIVAPTTALLVLALLTTGAASLTPTWNDHALTNRPGSSLRADEAMTSSAVELLDERSLEGELYALLNASRAADGHPPLAWDAALAAVIRAHNEDMLERGYFDHVSPDGDGAPERLARAGVPGYSRGSYWAENLSIDSNVGRAHIADMQDPSGEQGNHRANILDGRFTRVGISVLQHPDSRLLIGVLLLP